MATAPLDPAAPFAPTGLRLVAQVGIARWTVLIAAPTIARLGREHPDMAGDMLDPAALDRVMEGLRVKAVGLRWYGGGTLSIDPSDLVDTAPARGDDAEAADPTAVTGSWYEIVQIAPPGPPALRLTA